MKLKMIEEKPTSEENTKESNKKLDEEMITQSYLIVCLTPEKVQALVAVEK